MGSGFGAVGGYCALWWDRLKVLLKVARRLWFLSPLQRKVVWRVVDVVDDPSFFIAIKAVRMTATTLGFNRQESWGPLKAELKSDPGNAENTFRHLQTVHTLRLNCVNSTFTNPHAHLLAELAYHAYTMKESRGDL